MRATFRLKARFQLDSLVIGLPTSAAWGSGRLRDDVYHLPLPVTFMRERTTKGVPGLN